MTNVLNVRPTGAALGAEVLGIDLSKKIDDATFKQIVDAWHEHEVVFFRDQKLTPEQHVAFSRRFGELELHVRKDCCRPGYHELFVVSNILENGKPIGSQDAGLFWHSDLCYLDVPSRGSLLYALEVPHDDSGNALGDTCFASMTVAYDELPDDVKKRAEGISGVHTYTQQNERRLAKIKAQGGVREELTGSLKAKVPDVVHPVIRTHPVTGRKCVYVNVAFVIQVLGMDEAEGLKLRDYLIEHCTQPRFVYRHQWRAGDFLMWDNCATQHLAINDYVLPQRRLMYRTTVKGSVAPA